MEERFYMGKPCDPTEEFKTQIRVSKSVFAKESQLSDNDILISNTAVVSKKWGSFPGDPTPARISKFYCMNRQSITHRSATDMLNYNPNVGSSGKGPFAVPAGPIFAERLVNDKCQTPHLHLSALDCTIIDYFRVLGASRALGEKRKVLGERLGGIYWEKGGGAVRGGCGVSRANGGT